MSKHYKDLNMKYEHALDSMWALFKFGRDREKAMESKLNQIAIVCERESQDDNSKLDEIFEIVCDDRNGVGRR